MKESLKKSLPFAEAFARLLHPFAEVVIHDLKKDQIEAIYNCLSHREVGDCSHLDRLDFDESQNVIGPYSKTNWDGHTLKSISTVIRNEKGQAEGFLCINVAVAVFESARQMLTTFLENDVAASKETEKLFKEDLYEKINLYVQGYCHRRKTNIKALDRLERQEIVHLLAAENAFKERNAATYVGRVLGVSRATIYNYLSRGTS